jgi:hypothetical protein
MWLLPLLPMLMPSDRLETDLHDSGVERRLLAELEPDSKESAAERESRLRSVRWMMADDCSAPPTVGNGPTTCW